MQALARTKVVADTCAKIFFDATDKFEETNVTVLLCKQLTANILLVQNHLW